MWSFRWLYHWKVLCFKFIVEESGISMAAGPTCLAVIVGYSYVRRLGVFAVDNNISNLRLDREQFSVEIRGKGGLCLQHLHHDATIVQFQQAPDIRFFFTNRRK